MKNLWAAHKIYRVIRFLCSCCLPSQHFIFRIFSIDTNRIWFNSIFENDLKSFLAFALPWQKWRNLFNKLATKFRHQVNSFSVIRWHFVSFAIANYSINVCACVCNIAFQCWLTWKITDWIVLVYAVFGSSEQSPSWISFVGIDHRNCLQLELLFVVAVFANRTSFWPRKSENDAHNSMDTHICMCVCVCSVYLFISVCFLPYHFIVVDSCMTRHLYYFISLFLGDNFAARKTKRQPARNVPSRQKPDQFSFILAIYNIYIILLFVLNTIAIAPTRQKHYPI